MGAWASGQGSRCCDHLGLDCKVEGASFEGQHGAIVVSCSFRKNPDSYLMGGHKHMRRVSSCTL